MAFNQPAFFQAIVQKLHDDGTLRSYEKPKGTPHPEWGDWAKNPHSKKESGWLRRILPERVSLRKDPPGTVLHIGDEPYNQLTTGQLQYYQDILPSQQDIDLKINSTREAIEHYIPSAAFAQYLTYFQQHLDIPSHRAALENSVKQFEGQMPYEESDASIDTGKGTVLRAALSDSPLVRKLLDHPALATSFTIYHAAHSAYLKQLEAALHAGYKSGQISEEEHDNGIYTLHTSSFHQFESFLLFAVVAPLTLNEYNKNAPATTIANSSLIHEGSQPLAHQTNIDAADHERMKEAIGGAWKILIRKQLLHREYRAGDALTPNEGEKAEKRIFCPAHVHLQASAKDQLVERTYDYVLNNPEKTNGVAQLLEELKTSQRQR